MDVSPKRYQSVGQKKEDLFGAGENNECLHLHSSIGEWSDEPRWAGCLASGTLSLGKLVFSRLYVLLNYTSTRCYCSQPGDCTHFLLG